MRGGCFGFAENMIRCAIRWYGAPDMTGFRVVVEEPSNQAKS
jgi:hypothetical protein